MIFNCIIDLIVGVYDDCIWICSIVGWLGVNYLEGEDFFLVIVQVQQMVGFLYSEILYLIIVGFGCQILFGVVDMLIDLVSCEKLCYIFFVGGCDGVCGECNYFIDFVISVLDDCLILILVCGKYCFNKLDFGDIEGLLCLVDVGQCNDVYLVIILVVMLVEKLGCGVNDLLLLLVFFWFEQKVIVILLMLLLLGVKNIVIGLMVSGFFILDLLVVFNEKFGLCFVIIVE